MKSELDLEVYCCNKCKFYVCGNSFSEIHEKISKLYLKHYWGNKKFNNQTLVNLEYSDV